MLMSHCIEASQKNMTLKDISVDTINARVAENGWVFLRGFDVNIESFSGLIASCCDKLTFDPAREFGDDSSQKVNAGTDAIGLHIENGNTPFPPDIIAFFSSKSASEGSQTTVCDGSSIYKSLSKCLVDKFSQTITVKRKLPAAMWKRYIANEHPAVSSMEEVTETHLKEMLSALPNHRGNLCSDGSLDYELDIEPIIKGSYSNKSAFANAILGPSFNYEPPQYYFADGEVVDEDLKKQLIKIAEKHTIEIPWQDGDVAIIDNKRVMHGRREITNADQRELFICMGLKNGN